MLYRRQAKPVPAPEDALPGRDAPIETAAMHQIFDRPLKAVPPDGYEIAEFALGCFWGAERKFWQTPGIWLTAAGYAGGQTPNPTYREVCTGMTGHTETVRMVFDPAIITYDALLAIFWESHDPTQGLRQGNDVGSQYRSAIFTHSDRQSASAERSRTRYEQALREAGHNHTITTEIVPAGPFYYAEAEHQQYLAKNPDGYCGLGGTGVTCAL